LVATGIISLFAGLPIDGGSDRRGVHHAGEPSGQGGAELVD